MTSKNYGYIADPDEAIALVERLIAEGKPIGFDIETGYQGPDKEKAQFHPEEAFIVGFSITNSLNWARYVPMMHDFGENIDPEAMAPVLWKFAQSGLMVPYNAKFEMRFMAAYFRQYIPDCGDGYFSVYADPMIMAHSTGNYKVHALKPLTKEVFDHQMITFDELFPDGQTKKQRDSQRFNILELTPKVVTYACEDALWCLAHLENLWDLVKDSFIYKIEMGVLPIICRMEDYGIAINWAKLKEALDSAKEFKDLLYTEIMEDLSALLGREVILNLGSAQQLQKLLYEDLQLTTNRLTKGSRDSDVKKMSTDAVALETLAKSNEVVAKILYWKKMHKLISSYLDKYEKNYLYDFETYRLHPSNLQCGTVTGRFSVMDPNYQQLPKSYHYELRSGYRFDLNFRDLFTVPEGYYGLGFDYANQELRVMAGESQEPNLLDAFNNGKDVHKLTASFLLGKPIEEITKQDRQDFGKRMNFALTYEQGVKSFSEYLSIPIEEAQLLRDQFFTLYSQIPEYTAAIKKKARRDGYVTNKFGRKIVLWDYADSRKFMQEKGDRNAVNYPIQGAGTGDYTKIAMVRANNIIQNDPYLKDKVILVMNIHDALEFYVHESVAPEYVISKLHDAVVFPVQGWPRIEAEWHMWTHFGQQEEVWVAEDGSLARKSDPKPKKEVVTRKEVHLILQDTVTQQDILRIKNSCEGTMQLSKDCVIPITLVFNDKKLATKWFAPDADDLGYLSVPGVLDVSVKDVLVDANS